MVNDAPAIDRFGIPRDNWWSEDLHGVARAGLATVFPQAIGFGAVWDERLLYNVSQPLLMRCAPNTMISKARPN